jgi:hypothetical protein
MALVARAHCPGPDARATLRSAMPADGEARVGEWLEWEEIENNKLSRKTTKVVPVPVSKVRLDEVVVDAAADVDPLILRRFVRGDTVLWPRHPFLRPQTAEGVPFLDRPVAVSWDSRLTSSRSLVVLGEGRGTTVHEFSLKLPTNAIGDMSGTQKMKLDLRQELIDSRWISDHIARIDRRLGRDPELAILPDVLAIRDRVTGNGFTVRDIRALKSGRRYLPAFSLPTLGKRIAEEHGMEVGGYWRPAFHQAGRSEAKLVLRYGVVEYNLSPQNWKIELDDAFRPTGTIVLNDLGDWHLFAPGRDAVGFEGPLPEGLQSDKFFTPQGILFSGWTDYYTKTPPFPASVLDEWKRAFREGFAEELGKGLGLTPPELTGGVVDDAVGAFLRSPEVQAAWRRYHRR